MFTDERRNVNYSIATFSRCFFRSLCLRTITQLENFKENNLVIPLVITNALFSNFIQIIDLFISKEDKFIEKLKAFVLNLGINIVCIVMIIIALTLIAKFLYKKYEVFLVFKVILYSSILELVIFLISRSSFCRKNTSFIYVLVTNIICILLCIILFIRNMNLAD
ncbi:hypothetical protein H312_01466 [Anncaliia algerae PRA339]|uniref:Uncharacterized protein n=1 Tax=Anncaliia algerae PRA339 TaxID=1288291 RepID=A0A059F1R8_9MICR|nr:hypothetical protein H312_01466 [Anncaliia algerae PRA339]